MPSKLTNKGKGYNLYQKMEDGTLNPDTGELKEHTPTPEEIEQTKDFALKLMAASTSLVDFRRHFMPLPNEVESSWFHHYWSDILLRGKKNFVTEGFRESGKTSLVIKGAPLHALAYPQWSPRPGGQFCVDKTRWKGTDLAMCCFSYYRIP